MDGRIMIDAGIRDVTGRLRLLLAESPIADIRHVRVQQDGDRVLLAGSVRTFYAKQMAQETIRGAVRGLHIINEVKVD
jgi:osmotically-inducible protein OsmY